MTHGASAPLHSSPASTPVVYRSSLTRLHPHESLLDGPFTFLPHHHPSLLFPQFFNVLANLPSALLPSSNRDHHHRACLYLFWCSCFLFVCMSQSSIVGPSVHSAITLNKGSVELAALSIQSRSAKSDPTIFDILVLVYQTPI